MPLVRRGHGSGFDKHDTLQAWRDWRVYNNPIGPGVRGVTSPETHWYVAMMSEELKARKPEATVGLNIKVDDTTANAMLKQLRSIEWPVSGRKLVPGDGMRVGATYVPEGPFIRYMTREQMAQTRNLSTKQWPT